MTFEDLFPLLEIRRELRRFGHSLWIYNNRVKVYFGAEWVAADTPGLRVTVELPYAYGANLGEWGLDPECCRHGVSFMGEPLEWGWGKLEYGGPGARERSTRYTGPGLTQAYINAARDLSVGLLALIGEPTPLQTFIDS